MLEGENVPVAAGEVMRSIMIQLGIIDDPITAVVLGVPDGQVIPTTVLRIEHLHFDNSPCMATVAVPGTILALLAAQIDYFVQNLNDQEAAAYQEYYDKTWQSFCSAGEENSSNEP